MMNQALHVSAADTTVSAPVTGRLEAKLFSPSRAEFRVGTVVARDHLAG